MAIEFALIAGAKPPQLLVSRLRWEQGIEGRVTVMGGLLLAILTDGGRDQLTDFIISQLAYSLAREVFYRVRVIWLKVFHRYLAAMPSPPPQPFFCPPTSIRLDSLLLCCFQ